MSLIGISRMHFNFGDHAASILFPDRIRHSEPSFWSLQGKNVFQKRLIQFQTRVELTQIRSHSLEWKCLQLYVNDFYVCHEVKGLEWGSNLTRKSSPRVLKSSFSSKYQHSHMSEVLVSPKSENANACSSGSATRLRQLFTQSISGHNFGPIEMMSKTVHRNSTVCNWDYRICNHMTCY